MRRARIATIGTVLAGLVAAAPASANQPPVMQYDTYRMASTKSTLAVRAPGVLANDTDPDGDPLKAALCSGPSNGTLTLSRSGRFAYTPQPGFSGLEQFTYAARDGSGGVFDCTGHVYISVTRPPVAHDDSYAALSGVRRSIAAPGVMANDEGAEFVRLAEAPGHGTVSMGQDGRFNYRAIASFVGTDTFTYEAVVRGEAPSVATVTINVKASNQAPAPVGDAYSTPEDTPLFVGSPGLLANDFDADGDELVAEPVTDPYGDGFVLYPDGSFEYYPPPNFDSPVSFTYRVNDGLVQSAPVTVEIEIPAVDDPPIAEDDEYHFGSAGSIDVPAPGVLGNDFDEVEGDSLTAILRSRPRKGTLELESNGSFTYVRDPNRRGGDSFTYQVRDSGGAFGNIATVSIQR